MLELLLLEPLNREARRSFGIWSQAGKIFIYHDNTGEYIFLKNRSSPV